jgi:hypothetical protein
MKVVPENKIIVARSSSQRALTAAESGLSQVLFNLRNADFISETTAPSSNLEYLTIGNVESIASMNTGESLKITIDPPPPYGTSTPYVTYQVKILKTGGETWIPDNLPSDALHNVSLEIHSMGLVLDKKGGNVLARKVISTNCNVDFNKTTETIPLSLALLAGGDIKFSGGGGGKYPIEGGSVFANGNIIGKENKLVINGGSAYAAGTIPKGIASGGVNPGYGTTIEISQIYADYNKNLAWNFKTGAYPYNDSVAAQTDPKTGAVLYTYPNMSDPYVQSVIRNYLHGATEDTGDMLEDIHAFYNDLMNATGTEDGSGSGLDALNPLVVADLQKNAKKVAYYYNGDFTFNGSSIKYFGDEDKFYTDPNQKKDINYLSFGGIIIIDGDLSIESNDAIGDLNKLDLTFIVRGTVTIRTTGSAVLNGLLYAENGIKMESGSMEVNGAIITEGSIDVKGNSTITYHEMGLNTINVLKLLSSGVSNANIGLSSWKEISYDEF